MARKVSSVSNYNHSHRNRSYQIFLREKQSYEFTKSCLFIMKTKFWSRFIWTVFILCCRQKRHRKRMPVNRLGIIMIISCSKEKQINIRRSFVQVGWRCALVVHKNQNASSSSTELQFSTEIDGHLEILCWNPTFPQDNMNLITLI